MDANTLFHFIDSALIQVFRLPGNPVAGFYLGAAVISLACVLMGRSLGAVAARLGHDHFAAQDREMVRMHNLSVRALAAKDKASYLAGNRLANESFGKVFFAQAALFAATLAPVPFALWWLSLRFDNVGVPVLPGVEIGYTGAFVLAYAAVRLSISRLIRPKAAEAEGQEGEELLSFSSLGQGLPR